MSLKENHIIASCPLIGAQNAGLCAELVARGVVGAAPEANEAAAPEQEPEGPTIT